MSTKKKILLVVLFFMLVASNIFFIYKFFYLNQELERLRMTGLQTEINQEVLAFTNMFISEVLRSEKEISFETRLALENKVRDIDDKEIFDQWQVFTESQTEEEAQKEVTKLLEILVNKLR